MIQLEGISLGKRQQELNTQVHDAAKRQVDFDQIKAGEEHNDLDRLFKIELASKYKNIDYIMETLKSGDSLYISRSLKCLWLYEDEYSNVINADYIHHNIFPFMSLKMKKKMLTAISVHMKNESRAVDFHTYCMNIKMTNIAMKCLLSTSELFKLDFLKSDGNIRTLYHYAYDKDVLKYFVGNSFTLADACVQGYAQLIYKLNYLYSSSDVKYLDLLEKYWKKLNNHYKRFGLRMSKDIIKKHKDRVLKNIQLYLNVLNIGVVIKHSTCIDAKAYIRALCWDGTDYQINQFLKNYKQFLDLIPFEERLVFVKELFASKYEKKSFEMSLEFYNEDFYTLMTAEEKEAWALRHLESDVPLLGNDKEYVWYEFVNFKKAFLEIKKIIHKTPDGNDRHDIIEVLINICRNQRELEAVLNYYYERHVNENKTLKFQFLKKIVDNHRVLEFDDKSWTAFDKLLYSLGVYRDIKYGENVYYSWYCVENMVHYFRHVSLVYYTINNKELSEGLKQYLNIGINTHRLMNVIEDAKLNDEKKELVYTYIHKYYVDTVKSFDVKEYNDDIKKCAQTVIKVILDLMHTFKRRREDIPESVMKYINLNLEEYKTHPLLTVNDSLKITEAHLLRLLKNDAKLVVDDVLVNKLSGECGSVKIGLFLKKIKIYFSNDIAKEYEKMFTQRLTNKDKCCFTKYSAMFGIFQLSDQSVKVDFMTKYAPTESKINHTTIDDDLLYIRQSICRFAHYSRPPVPLENILVYIKGDYVQYCLPMFGSYFVNLPMHLCLKFVLAILNTPISVQKHGLRLAFKCFNTDDLIKNFLNIWKNTKNVSIRKLVFRLLFEKIKDETGKAQRELFEVSKKFILDLKEDDDENVFSLLTGYSLPDNMVGECIETAWKVVSKMSDKYSDYKKKIICSMNRNIDLIDENLLKSIVDNHIHVMLVEMQIRSKYAMSDITELNIVKWGLVESYILKFSNKEEMERKIELMRFILKRCFDMWNVVHDDEIYTMRMFCSKFIENINTKSRSFRENDSTFVNPILEIILNDLQKSFPLEQIYLMVWDLRLSLVSRTTIDDHRDILQNEDLSKVLMLREFSVYFGAEVGNLIKEFVEKKIYFPCLMDQLSELITSYMQNIGIDILNGVSYNDMDNAKTFLCVGLTNIDMPETYLMALAIIPLEFTPQCESDHEKVVRKIKTYKNSEVQSFMYQKFNKNFKRKKYV